MVVVQQTLDFPEDLITITFKTYTGTCSCGQVYECNRCSIALEMYIKCKNCGELIQVGEVKKALARLG